MKLRQGKISIISLLIITAVTILFMFFELNSKTKVRVKYFDEKIKAAELTQQCFNTIKQASDSLNIPIDRINDPNETGLIGLQYSPITTERGDLNAKLTSTNPNFAALIIQLLKIARVRKGDVIAVSLTGSLPALNIAVLSALKAVQAKPIIITSVGSSMWGANYPQFTYLDMEHILNQKGWLEFKTTAASIGGKDDIGRGLSPAGRENLTRAIKRNDVEILDVKNLEDAIKKRIDLYSEYGGVKVFINVDENTSGLAGINAQPEYIPARHIKEGTGIIAQFSQSGIPVINLIDINNLAEKYNLPIAPIPLPDVGAGNLYYEYKYSVSQAIIYLLILFGILFIILRFDMNYYFKKLIPIHFTLISQIVYIIWKHLSG
jgi:poly-gamma-glutamate system protein